ncbi:MAG: hypothetical protein ACI8P9_001733 [Parasphingorhabdus sp.]
MTKPTPAEEVIVDGENNLVLFDKCYRISSNLVENLDQIRSDHEQSVAFLPIGASSGGAGIFQVSPPENCVVAGIQIAPCSAPSITLVDSINLLNIELHEIQICQFSMQIAAGAGISLQQLNQALADHLGTKYRVLGADLTSYSYAQVGATFMTGGMGPQRRYFSDSVVAAVLFDGKDIVKLAGDQLDSYAGTYGWTGLVTAVSCQIHQIRGFEIAFSMPVFNSPQGLAQLLEKLSPFAFIKSAQGQLENQNGDNNLIFGIEHITTAAMGPLLNQGIANDMTRRAQGLSEKCQLAEADGLVFISGFSELSTDEFLMLLLDDDQTDDYTIAGIDLAHTEVFTNPDAMRALREAVPFAARTQTPVGKYIFKGHTDANIRLNPARVAESMSALWQANMDYVHSVQDFFDRNDDVRGEILIYGHLNPYGVDPHNRLTFACDDQHTLASAETALIDLRNQFLIALTTLCENTGSLLIGGEKGAASEREIYEALGGAENCSVHLQEKFTRQSTVIASAMPCFNWRALSPFRSS